MTSENFVSKLVQAVDELEKQGRGMHNVAVVEIIWQRFRNAELSQFLTAPKVRFQKQPHSYRGNITDTSDAFSYVKPYIKKYDRRADIKLLRIRYEKVAMKD